MRITIFQIKPVLLLIAILVGFSLNCTKAYAGKVETAIVAGGCFWCVESDFESVPGVIMVEPGYTGGSANNPSYKQITRGGTGHYQAVKITYDSSKVSYAKLINLFLRSVDPTDAGGQFCDRGDSYRSAIFVSSAAQKADASAAIADAQKILGLKIVTPVLNAGPFFKAEVYHQNYYKGTKLVVTRFGLKRQSSAYRAYRKACGRDARVLKLWGDMAPFAKGTH